MCMFHLVGADQAALCVVMMPASDRVGVVGCKGMQVSQLTQATLDVCYVDLDVVLEATAQTRHTHFDHVNMHPSSWPYL